MSKTILFSLAIAAMTLLAFTACTMKSETTNEVNNFRIKRGTNLSHWLSQNNEDRGEAREKHIQEDDFARLDSLGFDFVRIPIDEVQFWDEQGKQIPEAWKLLTFALDQCAKHHLRAIVDLHIIRSHYFNAVNEEDQAANTLFTSEKAQQDLINLWYQLSDALKGYSNDSVAYEFMNEPVADDQCALRLTLAQCLVHLGYQLVPLLMVFCHGLVHELVCDRVDAIAFQCIR